MRKIIIGHNLPNLLKTKNPWTSRDFLVVKIMLMRICNKCGRRLKQGEVCSCQRQRHKIYNSQYRDRVKNTFYHSQNWSRISKMAKERANGLDEYAFAVEHKLVKGNLTHHIFTLDERADLSLSLDNLIYVSTKTHALIHAVYEKGEVEKLEMQRRLLSIRKMT